MSDPVFSQLKAFKPKNAMSASFRATQRSLVPLMDVVPRIESDESILQKIDDQWRCLPDSLALLPTMIQDDIKLEPDLFWSKIYNHQSEAGVKEFKDLAKFALEVLSLPHANADCERVFSQVSRLISFILAKLILFLE